MKQNKYNELYNYDMNNIQFKLEFNKHDFIFKNKKYTQTLKSTDTILSKYYMKYKV